METLFRASEATSEMTASTNFQVVRVRMEGLDLALGEARKAYDHLAIVFNSQLRRIPQRVFVRGLPYAPLQLFSPE